MDSIAGKYLSEKLLHYQDVINERLPGIVKNTEKDDIHKVRLAIKKMSAIYSLLEFIVSKRFRDNKPYKKLLKIFQQLGKIRELQVFEKYMDRFQLPVSCSQLYEKYRSDVENKASEKLKKELKSYKNQSLRKYAESTLGELRHVSEVEIIHKTNVNIDLTRHKIQKQLKRFNNPKTVHSIRKKLKSIKYNAIFLYHVSPSEKTKIFIDKLEVIETHIGAWHDRRKLIRFISKLEKRYQPAPADRTAFNKIKNDLSKEDKNILINLKPKIQALATAPKYMQTSTAQQ